MALWFLNFSTWDGVAGIYVEDLFVWPRFRRRGLARGLLSTLARECVDNRYTRLAWSVLNWNSDAIALYDRIGGQPQHEWTIYRLSWTAVGCAGRTTLITPGGPADRRRTEQQYQHAKRDDSHRDPDRRLMRTHNQIPRHRQQQQLGEHRQPATPKLANRQPASGGEHCSADQYEPTCGAQAIDDVLVGARESAHQQRRGHHQGGPTLHGDDQSGAAHGGRGSNRHSISVVTRP